MQSGERMSIAYSDFTHEVALQVKNLVVLLFVRYHRSAEDSFRGMLLFVFAYYNDAKVTLSNTVSVHSMRTVTECAPHQPNHTLAVTHST